MFNDNVLCVSYSADYFGAGKWNEREQLERERERELNT